MTASKTNTLSFGNLVDVKNLQYMLEVGYAATGMPSGIIDANNGEVYAGTGWQRVCTQFHRVHPETNALCIASDTRIAKNLRKGESFANKCPNGMWDIGVPIYCKDEHIATYFLGQFFYDDEVPEIEFFTAQAQKYGFNESDYLDAVMSIPRFSREKVADNLKYNISLAAFLSDLASRSMDIQLELEQRRRAEKELQQLRNYLSNIIDSMPSMLIGVDPNGIITQWNTESEQETGIVTSDALGTSLGDTVPRLADDLEVIRTAIRTREQKKESRQYAGEDGRIKYEEVTFYPLIANGVEGAVIRIDDVTDRVNLEQIMVQSEKMLSVGGLAAGMAHEINNPLAAVLGYCFNIKKRLFGTVAKNKTVAEDCNTTLECVQDYLRKRDVDKMVDGISEAGERAAEIVSNMLSFSRKSEQNFERHNLSELMDKTIELAASDYDLKKKYDFRKIEMIRDYADNVPNVLCEGREIQQVLLNLLKNGAEAMAEKTYGAQDPQFKLSIRQDSENTILIKVCDNGPGMADSIRKRVLEPFFTTKEVGKGTGLGLSVSYFIITDQHGGTMDIESAPGEWTCFTITLPISQNK